MGLKVLDRLYTWMKERQKNKRQEGKHVCQREDARIELKKKKNNISSKRLCSDGKK